MAIRTYTIIFFLFFLILPGSVAYAVVDFYANCTKGYQFSDNQMQSIVLSPLNRTCQSRCASECGAFSRIVKNSNQPGDPGTELNSTIITACMPQCQAGILFKSNYYEAQPRAELTDPIQVEIKAPVAIGSACIEGPAWVADNAYVTNFTVKSGDKVQLSFVGNTSETSASQHNTSQGSKVYLCGMQEKNLVPIFPNTNASGYSIYNTSDWNNTKQTAWANRTNHACLLNLTDTEWNTLSNKSLWFSPPWSLPPYSKPDSDICNWSARSKTFTDTGIYIQDGDELSIKWSGNYAYQISGNIYDRQNIIACMNNTNLSSQTRAACTQLWQNISTLWLNLGDGNTIFLTGEDARPQNVPIGSLYQPPNPTQPPPYIWHGLTGKVIDVGLKSEINRKLPQCSSTDPQDQQAIYQNPSCLKVLTPGNGDYTFSGVLKGLANKRSPLQIQHSDASTSQDHLGGYNVNVIWGGCVYQGGQRVQYAVLTADELAAYRVDATHSGVADSEWQDVPDNVFGVTSPGSTQPTSTQPLVVQTSKASGTLLLRIKSLSAPGGVSDDVAALYEPANRFGSYYILGELLGQPSSAVKAGPLTTLLKLITDQFLGHDRKPGMVLESGVVYKIFSSITQGKIFQNLIYAMVIAYISFTGLALLIGIIELNQQEAIKRLVKVGIVLAVISPNSWEFFGGYLVPFFIDGSITIIAMILSASVDLNSIAITQENLLQDPLLIFTIFDAPLTQIFSAAVWKKIAGLILTSSAGLLIAFAILFAMWYYVLMLVKASVMYIFSILMTSLLIVMGPIFVPMMLFKKTFNLFENWWKQLFSFMIQPIMVFSSIALFNIVILALLRATLGFTVCPSCILEINLSPIYQACWIPGYAMLSNTHMPVDTASISFVPLSILSGALAWMLIGQGAYGFCGFMAKIASTIVTGSPIRIATIEGPASNAMDSVENLGKAVTNKVPGVFSKGKEMTKKAAGLFSKGKDGNSKDTTKRDDKPSSETKKEGEKAESIKKDSQDVKRIS